MKHLSRIFVFTLLLPSLVLGQVNDPNAGTFNAAFEKPADLTDQQASTAKNFVHQGIKDQKFKEGCARLNNCLEDTGFPLEEVIGKAYGMLGMLGGGTTIKMKPTEQQLGDARADFRSQNNIPENQQLTPDQERRATSKAEGEEKTDWCQVAAMANETLGGMIQNHMQQQAAQRAQAEFSKSDTQLSALQQIKEMHKSRKKTANWQSAAYGTITACYAAYIAKGGAIKDPWKIYAKMGGAAALTYLYIRKANKHKKAMGIVDEVIATLPKAGECNPYTKTACFCSEKTSKEKYPDYFQEVCVLNAGNFDTPITKTACGTMVNGKVTLDTTCKCKVTNTCVTPKFGNIAGNFNFGSNLMKTPDEMLQDLYGGEFDEGKLRDYSLNTAAMSNRIRAKNIKLPKPNLTDEQKKLADALSEVMPRELANIAAASPTKTPALVASSGGTPNVSALPKEVKEKLAEAISVDYKKGNDNSLASSDDEASFEMPKMPGQESSSSSTEVVNFTEKAFSKADVSNSPETPIFDIISNRYRRSGWNKLQTVTE